MTLAQRVRDFRYAKGWGPDELANRAEISRTALYQIESGKTGLPRAGTLRRIAVALDVSMDALLGEENESQAAAQVDRRPAAGFASRSVDRWLPGEGGPLTLPPAVQGPTGTRHVEDHRDHVRPAADPGRASSLPSHESVLHREGELMSKLHDLLHSPVGSAVARVLDELHGLMPRSRHSL
ncbi:helix-turn-helix domain-containing protein [Paludisphaera sp.]|uniref:helix-turn-helix domain-containing protein n=1 Tax=Paludisphaera sp. TaxID=2017432 RepID=UPI00301B7984